MSCVSLGSSESVGGTVNFGPNWVRLEWEARVVRYLTTSLSLGSLMVLTGLLAGCSAVGQTESTSAIAGPAVASADAAAEPGTMQANATTGQPSMVGKAITLADASCDQIKAEVATFDADKIPQKLADFGKAKYHPTAEESIRFARYVDVSKAGKDKNCTAGAKPAKKQVTASKTPATVDPASAKAKKPVVAAAKAPVAATTVAGAASAKAMKKPVVAAAKKPVMTTPAEPAAAVVDEGVTVTVPDSSG